MRSFKVIEKSSGKAVYQYTSEAAVEWHGMEYTTHDHIEQVVVAAPVVISTNPVEWLIDVGPFMDRFGNTKMAVLTSNEPIVKAILQDMYARKWIDLKRADVTTSINAISAYVPSVAPIKEAILTTPVTQEENLALRRLYFTGAING